MGEFDFSVSRISGDSNYNDIDKKHSVVNGQNSFWQCLVDNSIFFANKFIDSTVAKTNNALMGTMGPDSK